MDYSAIEFQPVLTDVLAFIQNSDLIIVALGLFAIPLAITVGKSVFHRLRK